MVKVVDLDDRYITYLKTRIPKGEKAEMFSFEGLPFAIDFELSFHRRSTQEFSNLFRDLKAIARKLTPEIFDVDMNKLSKLIDAVYHKFK